MQPTAKGLLPLLFVVRAMLEERLSCCPALDGKYQKDFSLCVLFLHEFKSLMGSGGANAGFSAALGARALACSAFAL